MAYVKTLSINGTKYDIKDANAVQLGTSSSSVAQNVYGKKTFVTGIATKTFELTKQDSAKEGGEIVFKSGDTEPNTGKDIFLDRYDGNIRIFGQNSSGTSKVVFRADVQNNVLYGTDNQTTPAITASDQAIPTTNWISRKFKYENSEPASKTNGVFYFIKEG